MRAGDTQAASSSLPLSILDLRGAIRRGGRRRARRHYRDFVVDGRVLGELLDAPARDLVTTLGWLSPEVQALEVDRLLLWAPSDLADDRQALYVCPQCADVGCGAITVVVEHRGNQIVWRDFAFQSTSGVPDPHPTDLAGAGPFFFDMAPYAGVGPFAFAEEAYTRTLLSTLTQPPQLAIDHLGSVPGLAE